MFLAVCAGVELPAPGRSAAVSELQADASETPAVVAREELRRLGARFSDWAPRPQRATASTRRGGNARLTCEVPEGVVLSRGPSGMRYAKPARVSGAFALRLMRFEHIVQEEAHRHFGQRIARVEHLGAYTCRTIAGTSWPSEHASGNAIDVSSFVLRGGQRISVARDFARAGTPAAEPAAAFLRRVAERLRSERVFSVVLTPDYDAQHRNHFHLDGRRRWWSWFTATS